MSIEERMAKVLVQHQGPDFYDGRGIFACYCRREVLNDDEWAYHVTAVLVAEINPIVITAAASGIRAYIASKIEALSYHGDESAIAALKQMAIVADDIVRYGLDVDPPGRNEMKDG